MKNLTKLAFITGINLGIVSSLLAENEKPVLPLREVGRGVSERINEDTKVLEGEGKSLREQYLPKKDRRRFSARGSQNRGKNYKRFLKRYDVNNDGELSEEERKIGREEIAKKFGSREERMKKRLIDKFDADGDGELSELERERAKKSMKKHQRAMCERSIEVKKLFIRKFDSDRDGVLSDGERAEAKDMMAKKMAVIKSNLIKEYDADGDEKLSKPERKKAHEKEKLKMLKRFDADGDDRLDTEEKKTAFSYMMEHEPYKLMHQMMSKKSRRRVGDARLNHHSKRK